MRMPWRLVSPDDLLNDTSFPSYYDSDGRCSYRTVHTPTNIGAMIRRMPAIIGMIAVVLFYIIYGTIWAVANTILSTIDVILRLFTESLENF